MVKKSNSFKEELYSSLDDGGLSKFFFVIVLVYAIFYTIETVPAASKYIEVLKAINIFFNVIFVTEYIVRIIAAPKKKKYIFSFWGMIDFLSLMPIYFLSFDLFNIKFIRLLRVLKIFKNKYFFTTLLKLGSVFQRAKYELIVFLTLSVIFVYLAALGIYFFEHEAQPENFSSIPDSIWWAIITLTTIGYGDIYPITVGGKIFTVLITYVGLAFVAVPTSIITLHITEIYRNDKK